MNEKLYIQELAYVINELKKQCVKISGIKSGYFIYNNGILFKMKIYNYKNRKVVADTYIKFKPFLIDDYYCGFDFESGKPIKLGKINKKHKNNF